MSEPIIEGTNAGLAVAEAVFADEDVELLFCESDPTENRTLAEFEEGGR